MLKAMKTFCLERPDENLITRKGCQTKNAANVQRRFRRFPGEYRIPHQATTKAHLKFFTCTRFHQSSHFYSKFSPCDEEENWKIMSERNWIKLRASFILSIVAAHSMLLCFPCFVQCHFFNCRIIVNQNVSQQRSRLSKHMTNACWMRQQRNWKKFWHEEFNKQRMNWNIFHWRIEMIFKWILNWMPNWMRCPA